MQIKNYNMIFNNEKIKDGSFLITGGAGFIGSNIVEFLIQHNAKKIRILDNLCNGFLKNIKDFLQLDNVEFIQGDIRDIETCVKACQNIDYVSHQAALGSVPRSINDPITSIQVNIVGFTNMLIAARDAKVKRFVYASSSSVYGDNISLPKVEDLIGKPLSPYSATKYMNEILADIFNKVYDCKLQTIGLRYFNVFGPKQDPNGVYASVIPLFIQNILNNNPIYVNGHGKQTRDFTYIENVVQMNLLSLLTDNVEALNQVYNVGVGEQTSLLDLIEILKNINNAEIIPIYRDARPGDVLHSKADINKAIKFLNYQPTTFFKEGIIKTYHWYKNNQDFIKSF